jgi:hypothetical protein
MLIYVLPIVILSRLYTPPPPSHPPLTPHPPLEQNLIFVSMFVYVLGLDPTGYPD